MSVPADRRRELEAKIRQLEGLSNEDRSALLGLLGQTKRYGLVWEEKPEDAHEILRKQIPVFVEDKKRRIDSDTDDAPHHVLIEGDNLHALAALQYTHAGKVDVIYIDPPYNTGNKDFRYNDDYVNSDDQWRHSKWISFMSKRIRLAKQLLSASGVIFISIDDNEFGQLKMICDEILLEGSLVGNIVWLRKKKPSFLSKGIVRITENILCYKNGPGSECILFGDAAYSEKAVPLVNRSNRENQINFPGEALRVGRGIPDGIIRKGLFGNGELSVVLENDAIISNGKIVNPISVRGRFRWSEVTVLKELAAGSEFVASDTFRINVYRADQSEKSKAPSSLLTPDKGVGTNEDATAELSAIFAGNDDLPFSYPKPVSLVRYLIRAATNEKTSAIILDFFAGSGTTLHATMALNAEDDGKRQCILVTNNENNICEEVTYERNKRVIQGYTTPKGEQVAGLAANHLHYFKTEFVQREPNLKNRRQLMKLSVDLLRLKENAWVRIDALCVKNEVEAFQGEGFALFVVLDTDSIPLVIAQIKAQPGRSKVYVFSPGAYAWDEEFEEVRERIDLCAVPEAIYRALEPHLPAVKRIDDEVLA